MIGSTVSHYRVLRKIGEGGMGEVFLAEDLKLHREVALKFLAAHWTRDPDKKARFLREARAAAAIEHPHVAAIHDVDEAERRTFIAMEYVRGESLRHAILRETIPPGRAVELTLQVASGLELAHARGIVHRDLKPENVLLSEQGQAKIIDFGLAKLLEPAREEEPGRSESATFLKTRDGIVMGTAAYMSPEQARGTPVDARSDLFSLGVMLHEMLSGESPFRRASAVETLNAILNDNPSVRNVPLALERVLKRALAKDPAQRYQTAADLASGLHEAQLDLASGEHRSRRRFRLWASAIGIAAALAALVWALAPRGEAPGIGASGRPAITALSFENHSNDDALAWLSHGLPGMLLTGLAQTPGLDVISTRKVEEVLEGSGAAIDKPAPFSEAARRAGAGAIVTGSIYKSGAELRLEVRIEDLESGRLLASTLRSAPR